MSGVLVQGCAILLAFAVVGCSAVNESPKPVSVAGVVTPIAVVATSKSASKSASKSVTLLDRVVWNAQKQQGKMYRWGGTSPVSGFDCSGLTQYAFRNGAQVSIPRTAAEQYAAAVKVPKEQSQKGDLVFFNTSGKRVSHVGIYLGNNKFVHAPRTGRAIATDQLKGYWANRLVGFGRIPGACRPSYS
ncbi:C40 family peptidase [Thiothrix litoralis]|jgi:cell wall-associated NlpC family hydrolase|uniref:C40 family peptidase n=1 Tax=Thiothrix litoralis TaxID=2891210 RepID=A0ABX7WTC2_9GAMM|nr:C40 family peptidase [Thiothrix litoralis]QTR46456.1 C40 family peptidase [Thiothrix litoralis]